jgi:hypothetical protein
MTTANQVIARAYRLINEVGRTDVPSAEQYDDGLLALNDLLHAWRAEDIDLGVLDATTSTVIQDQHVMHVTYNLGLELAMQSGLDIHPLLVQRANELKGQLENPVIPEIEIDSALLSGVMISRYR